jgi:hypothetical protein
MDMPGVAFPDTMIALRLPEHEVAPPYLGKRPREAVLAGGDEGVVAVGHG